jgi:hypothetical protein
LWLCLLNFDKKKPVTLVVDRHHRSLFAQSSYTRIMAYNPHYFSEHDTSHLLDLVPASHSMFDNANTMFHDTNHRFDNANTLLDITDTMFDDMLYEQTPAIDANAAFMQLLDSTNSSTELDFQPRSLSDSTPPSQPQNTAQGLGFINPRLSQPMSNPAIWNPARNNDNSFQPPPNGIWPLGYNALPMSTGYPSHSLSSELPSSSSKTIIPGLSFEDIINNECVLQPSLFSEAQFPHAPNPTHPDDIPNVPKSCDVSSIGQFPMPSASESFHENVIGPSNYEYLRTNIPPQPYFPELYNTMVMRSETTHAANIEHAAPQQVTPALVIPTGSLRGQNAFVPYQPVKQSQGSQGGLKTLQPKAELPQFNRPHPTSQQRNWQQSSTSKKPTTAEKAPKGIPSQNCYNFNVRPDFTTGTRAEEVRKERHTRSKNVCFRCRLYRLKVSSPTNEFDCILTRPCLVLGRISLHQMHQRFESDRRQVPVTFNFDTSLHRCQFD